jgi:hypothetical protein
MMKPRGDLERGGLGDAATDIAPGLCWATSAAAEPALARLEALAWRSSRGNFPEAWRRLKSSLSELVGFGRQRPPPWLGTSKAYEVAATHLARALEEPRGRGAA